MGGFGWRDLAMDGDSSTSYVCSSALVSRLPPELLSCVFTYLPGKDVANASRVCKFFYAASRIDCVWQKRCLTEYNAVLPPNSKITYLQLYSQILHKYGHLIGFWTTDIAPYGGFLQVKVENEGLTGIEWHPPSFPGLKEPLRRKVLFSIEVTPDNKVEIFCQKGKFGKHRCHLEMKERTTFYSKCSNPECHDYTAGQQDEEFQEWLQGETKLAANLDRHAEEMLLMKFLNIREYRNSFQHRRLRFPSKKCPNILIQPGLFKGSYAAHGLQLIMLSYESGTNVRATKITGDTNVPAGKLTFMCDLRYPIVLDEVDQQNSNISQQETVAVPRHWLRQLKPQPFRVPDDCINRDQSEPLPRTCKARFKAYGQIAGHGFTHPSFLVGHWIIFNEDLFAFMWFELHSLYLFHRVLEPAF